MSLHILWQFFYWFWVGSEVALIVFTRTRRSTGETHDRGSILVLWIVIFASIWFALGYGATHPHTLIGGAHWLQPLGLALLVTGIAVRWTAILFLGRSFSVNVAIHATQTVYRRGLFLWICHPRAPTASSPAYTDRRRLSRESSRCPVNPSAAALRKQTRMNTDGNRRT